jgi:HSP20 family molecular chaperone IbpA
VLTAKGEERSETEEKDRQFSDRFYGRFERRIPIGYEIASRTTSCGRLATLRGAPI